MIQIICGVDISKTQLDAAIGPNGAFQSFANTPEGIAALAAFCQSHGVGLVAMEATGGFERQPYVLLWQKGLACAIVNAGSVRHFAQSMGFLEKTDRIDAAMIARFAETKGTLASAPPSEDQSQLKALVKRLSQLTGDLTISKQRLSSTTDAIARSSLSAQIAFLKQQARTLEGEIASRIDDDPLWAKLAETFQTVKGVARRTIARLMADLPEIGLLTNKAISKLVGLAPLADDSGKRNGKRATKGGRRSVRSILFLVAAIAARFDQTLDDFAQRLLKAGKPKMVVRIALAHKLLVRLNAKARDARTELKTAT